MSATRPAYLVRPIPYGCTDYQATLPLREAVLRAPLGLSLTAEDLAGEAQQWHFGAYAPTSTGAELVACVIGCPQYDTSPTSGRTVKIRQMAVAPTHQGLGVGRQLMQTVEQFLRERGCQHITLHARQTATGFYTRLGYQPHGQPFTEVGIPHIAMGKDLPTPEPGTTGRVVYLLSHTSVEANREHTKLIGAFSTQALAEAARQHYRHLAGFRDRPEGLVIDVWDLNQPTWTEGFPWSP